ncbi:RIO kinase 1 [Crossiella equi]|uniref:non-specific serine/threonine protein kinase n=1 Tax=Crossiella equi TaxID=130796 RepID=A0ABS5AKQ2_9PSEU|nr:RIO1 family regulatory kinase/ATPase [Crossiella equi]MBP2477146.1 RIO kinase 1 [Crossiella equi]
MREHEYDNTSTSGFARSKRRKKRFDDDEPRGAVRRRSAEELSRSERGPWPQPEWLVTHPDTTDVELGILKTGKEADVHLIERTGADGTTCLLAAKRYRKREHRMFHRDAGYLDGRKVAESRQMRAMTHRTAFGRDVISAQWAVAEFAALSKLWQAGAPVPYPVQLSDTELLLEFLSEADGTAAPRLAQLRPEADELRGLWRQLVQALLDLAALGLTHGDLSPYNLLVHRGRLVLIDLPQAVDLVANPQAATYLDRDVRGVCDWFRSRGLSPAVADEEWLVDLLSREAGLR